MYSDVVVMRAMPFISRFAISFLTTKGKAKWFEESGQNCSVLINLLPGSSYREHCKIEGLRCTKQCLIQASEFSDNRKRKKIAKRKFKDFFFQGRDSFVFLV